MSILETAPVLMCWECEWAGCDACGGTGSVPAYQAPLPARFGEVGTLEHTVTGFVSTLRANLERAGGVIDENAVSPAEVTLAAALYDAGVQGFEQQHPVGPFFPDFFFPDCGLVVEVDGREFHQDAEKDERRTAFLLQNGVTEVLRLRALLVFTDPTGCVEEIRVARERISL